MEPDGIYITLKNIACKTCKTSMSRDYLCGYIQSVYGGYCGNSSFTDYRPACHTSCLTFASELSDPKVCKTSTSNNTKPNSSPAPTGILPLGLPYCDYVLPITTCCFSSCDGNGKPAKGAKQIYERPEDGKDLCSSKPYMEQKAGGLPRYAWIIIGVVVGLVCCLLLIGAIVLFVNKEHFNPCSWCECCPNYYDYQ